MYDSRVTLLIPETVITADGATNGNDIWLTENIVGDHILGTGLMGFVAECLAKSVVTGTGDGFTVTVKWQAAPDSSGSPGTYVDMGVLGVFTVDTDGKFVIDGTSAPDKTRDIFSGRVRTALEHVRLVATAAGITGGESITIKAQMADGGPSFPDNGLHR